MAKKMKKALCILLAVVLAFGSFAVSAFAYSGYDQDGANSNLRVQSVVTTDATTYAVDDTVTATITLNHPDDSVIGYQGFVAFDSSVLEFTGVEPVSGFEFFSETTQPTADSVVALDPASLTRGVGGDALTAESFASLLGAAPFSAPAVVNVPLLNLTGLEAGSHPVFNITFKAKAAVSSTRVALVPSVVFSSGLGYLNCMATTSTEGVYESAFSAVTPSRTFKIEGGSADVYYDITFSWNGGSDVVNTKQGATPDAPSVPDYDDGDYHYTFSEWSPALAPATAATTYVAQYSSTFVAADYDAYNAAVAAATAKRDNGTNWTEESVAALNTELDKDVSGLGRTSQATVDAQTAAINAAADALAEKAAVYTIKFVVKGEEVSSQEVTAGQMPVIPSVNDYEDDAKTYTFTGWDKEVVAAAGSTTYTAVFSETWKEYPITFIVNGQSTTVNTHWGDLPAAPAVSGYEDDTYTYTFKAWSPALTECAGSATYTATFDKEYKTFTVTFLDEDGTQISKKTDYHYGDTVTVPTDPTKAADNTYTYTFAGWDKAVETVTKDATYTATYSKAYIDYTIKFVGHDGEISSKTYHYGDTVTVPSVLGYEDDTYTYAFKDWSGEEVTAVTGDKTYTADYTATYKEYTITFKWANGGEETVTAHWGDMPVAPSVPSYAQDGKTYSFIGWEPALVACAGDATYTAQYSSEDIYYNITFIIEGVSSTQSVKAGSMPVVPELVNHVDAADGDYDINFTGWDVTPVAATADATYTATYTRDFVAADYTAVDTAKAIAAEINRDIYTDDSLAVLDKAMADVVEGLGRTKQEEVNAMASAIANAADDLVLKGADYTAYNAAVEALRAELAKSDYTPDSITAVTGKLNTIDNALDKELDITNQKTVDDAKDAVNALFAELVVKADKESLKSLIDEAKALDSDKYVDFSAVTTALANAETVYADDNATNDEVASAMAALRTALGNLVKKDADYSDWNALEAQFVAIEKQYYTPESVAAVEAVLAKVETGKDIDYQPTLDALVAELTEAMNGLELIKSWAGEADWEGTSYEYFHSNLEFVQEIDESDATNIIVKVYLNHPMNQVDGIQIAALYDAQAMTYKSVEINNGSLIYANTGDASFDPTDYALDSMGKAGILKFAADFDATLAPSDASKDLVATLHFTATGAASTSYIKTVPLAANNVADRSNYSALIYGDDETTIAESYMHNDAATLALAEVETGTVTGTVNGDNNIADVTVELKNGDDVVATQVIKGADAVYSFDTVLPGIYTITMSAPGSIGFKVYNVVVTAGATKSVDSIFLLYGDADGDGIIAPKDISQILTDMASESYIIASDPDGDGVVAPKDAGVVLLNNHLGQSADTQFITLD